MRWLFFSGDCKNMNKNDWAKQSIMIMQSRIICQHTNLYTIGFCVCVRARAQIGNHKESLVITYRFLSIWCGPIT